MEWRYQIEEALHGMPANFEKLPDKRNQYHVSYNSDSPVFIWFETAGEPDISLTATRLLNVWATLDCGGNQQSVDVLRRMKRTFGTDDFQCLSVRENNDMVFMEQVAEKMLVFPDELERMKALRRLRGARLFELSHGEGIKLYFVASHTIAVLYTPRLISREPLPSYHSVIDMLNGDSEWMSRMCNVDAKDKYAATIRKRPGMYVGSLSSRGLRLHLLRLVQETLLCTDNTITLELLSDRAVRLSGKSDYRIPKDYVTELQIAHALSSRFSWHDKDTCIESEKGEVKQVERKGMLSGFSFEFQPDPEVYEDTALDYYSLLRHLKVIAYLYSSSITVMDRDNKNTLFFPDGLLAYWNNEQETWLHYTDPLVLQVEQDGIKLDMVYGFTHEEGIRKSYVNGWATADKGTHVEGLYLGIQRAFGKYHRLHGEEPFEKLHNLGYIVHVQLENPRYAGPTRDKITNYEVRKLVRGKVFSQLFSRLQQQRNDFNANSKQQNG